MKVLYLVTGIRPPKASGSEFIQNLIFEISKKGVEATIISPIYIHTEKNMASWAAENEKKYNIKFVLIDTPTFIKRMFLLHLAITPLVTSVVVLRLLLKERFDLIHEFTSTPVILLRALIYKLFHIPSLFTLAVFNKSFLGKLYWFKVFDFGSAYLIPSHEIVKSIITLGVKKQKVFYLPPGINVARFRSKINKAEARQKLGLPKNLIILTYFGPINEEKGVFDIVEASKSLSKEAQKKTHIALFCYYLKGFGDYKNMVKKLNECAPINVRLYEKYVDIPLLLSASDCVIFPPRTGHGATIPAISILETLASKKPIITTNIIGTRELIDSNGILVPPSAPLTLSQAIESVSRNLPKFDVNNDLEDFNLKNVTNRLLSIYKEVYEK